MRYHLIALLLVITSFGATQARADIRGLPEVTILAEASLTHALNHVIQTYSRQQHVTVTASYDATSEQALKIEDGASADIFISSHPDTIKRLKQQGLLDVYSISNIVKDRLAVVRSRGYLARVNFDSMSSYEQLLELGKRTLLVATNPQDTALGSYTKQTLQNISKGQNTNLWQTLKDRFIRTSTANETLYLIAHGKTAGVVYHSNASQSGGVSILSVIDDNMHSPIIYQAAVVAGENMTQAREFLTFLKSNQAKNIFKKYGFIVDLNDL